jgi:endonuclease YncB( thermonuclease family)
MASPYLLLLRGRYVVIGKAPDGDSIRFIPDTPAALDQLYRSDRIRVSSDGSVQLRLEGIDTPELHYNGVEQPQGKSAREALLDLVGFSGITDTGPTEYTVTAATPSSVDGTVLASGADPNGRVIAYALDRGALASRADASWARVSSATIDRSYNGRLLASGAAYLTVYTSTAAAHRTHLRSVADKARRADRGVWKIDATAWFTLRSQADIGPTGALVLPKLFRRATDYLRANVDGTLPDWIRNPGPNRDENDGVVLNGRETTLADLVRQSGDVLTFTADLLDVVFVER